MKKPYELIIVIPSGIECKFEHSKLVCKKNGKEAERKIFLPGTQIEVKDDKLIFKCAKANRKNIAAIKTQSAHIKNIFKGFENEYKYVLEICHVHFPMTIKIDKNNLVVTNFLGEKKNRVAVIPHGVNVKVDGQKILVTSHDLEKAGQTAAGIERATLVSKRDRRVFQDGIFIVRKPGEENE